MPGRGLTKHHRAGQRQSGRGHGHCPAPSLLQTKRSPIPALGNDASQPPRADCDPPPVPHALRPSTLHPCTASEPPLHPVCTPHSLTALPAVQAAAAAGAGPGECIRSGCQGRGSRQGLRVQDPDSVQDRLGCMARLACRSIWDVRPTWTSGAGSQFRPAEATLAAPSPACGL